MPLQHSEDISVVAQAIPLLEQFSDAATADVARRHLLQLQRFGRYPHRNAALGRVSSPEEVVFTQQSQRWGFLAFILHQAQRCIHHGSFHRPALESLAFEVPNDA